MEPDPELREQVRFLPHKAGVYQFSQADGKVLYVGKAKDIRKRVASYFTKDQQQGKVALLLKKAKKVDYMVVRSEMEALLLENSLIKKYQPKYNVQLKDDKTYPWICIKNERFPRIFSTRHPENDGSEYFGPYASVSTMRTLLDLVRKLYPLRTCHYDLSQKNIEQGKFRVCLEYHIGNCLGPCEGLQSEEAYNRFIHEARKIIKGNIKQVKDHLKKEMEAHAEAMAFEKADRIRKKLQSLEKYQSKFTVVSPGIHNVEVLGLIRDQDLAFVNYMKVMNGTIVQGHTFEMKARMEESDERLLDLALTELRQSGLCTAKEIIVPLEPDTPFPDTRFKVPKRGDKKKLLEMAERNARHYNLEKRRQVAHKNPEEHRNRKLRTLQKELDLSAFPEHIECFDNSNTQGHEPVSACVVFRNGKPAKKEYRSFNIKSVEGPDDYATMKEAIGRRYGRMLEENHSLPQLVVIDGGKGQLGAAVEKLGELGIQDRIHVIGIAKKLEEIYKPGDSVPIYLDKRSDSLKLIQYLRDEAHRFSLKHHRQRRRKKAKQGELTEIPGIGPETARKLLQHFRSVKRVREASWEDLTAVVGKNKAEKVRTGFGQE